MTQMTGKYQHEKNENLDEYFKAIGVPYIPRKMMCATSPSLEITNENDQWTITTRTLLRTSEIKFKIGEEYQEEMPANVFKSVTTLEDDKLVTNSSLEDGTKFSRVYEFNDTHCILTMKHDKSSVEAKRYFRRL